MKNVLKISAMLLFTLLISCGNDDEVELIEVFPLNAYTSLEEAYGCVNTPYNLDISLDNTFAIIFTQTGFNSSGITGTCLPEIDYEMYDLIIGKQTLTSGFETITYSEEIDQESNGLTLTVTITLNVTAETPNITYHRLVPKLTNPTFTMVDVIIN